MIERIRYIKTLFGNVKQGVIVLLYDQGHFGVGMSFCNSSEDKFDKEVGKKLARDRAMESLKKGNLYLRDLDKAVDPFTICKLAGCNFPLGQRIVEKDDDHPYKICDIVDTFTMAVSDLIYTLALSKVKSETVA